MSLQAMAANQHSSAAMAMYDHQTPGLPASAVDEGKPAKQKKGRKKKKRAADAVAEVDDA